MYVEMLKAMATTVDNILLWFIHMIVNKEMN